MPQICRFQGPWKVGSHRHLRSFKRFFGFFLDYAVLNVELNDRNVLRLTLGLTELTLLMKRNENKNIFFSSTFVFLVLFVPTSACFILMLGGRRFGCFLRSLQSGLQFWNVIAQIHHDVTPCSRRKIVSVLKKITDRSQFKQRPV